MSRSDDDSVILLSDSDEASSTGGNTPHNPPLHASAVVNSTAVSPYGTWVSEVMLQQTRVDTVIPHWLAWMQRFPTCAALASASEDDVVAQWAGLGFYRRARQLRKGALHVQEHMGGRLPRDPALLQKIPGIGPYTAGAIASIAHGQQAAIVDGNVVRVWCRMRGLVLDGKAPATIKACWPISKQMVPKERPGDFNQALMELGATVCAPRSADCPNCPVAPHCRAHKQAAAAQYPELVLQYPAAVKKQANKVMHGAAVTVAWLQGDTPPLLLLQRRSEGGLLSQAWGPPTRLTAASSANDITPSCEDVWGSACSAVAGLGRGSGDGGAGPLPAPVLVKHVFSGTTHIINSTCVAIESTEPPPPTPSGFRWLAVGEAGSVKAAGLTTWACKLLAAALGQLPACKEEAWFLELARRAKYKLLGAVGSAAAARGTKRAVDSSAQPSLQSTWDKGKRAAAGGGAAAVAAQ